MKTDRTRCPRENSVVLSEGSNGKKPKRRPTLGKLFSAFGRAKKLTPPSSSGSIDGTDVAPPRMSSSPSRVNSGSMSSLSSSSSSPLYNRNLCRTHDTGTTTAGCTLQTNTGTWRSASAQLAEKGTQTVVFPSQNRIPYHNCSTPDTILTAYSKYDGSYPTKWLSKCDVKRCAPANVADAASMTAAVPNWQSNGGKHVSGCHRSHSYTNETDILSFFDTGSIDCHSYLCKCGDDASGSAAGGAALYHTSRDHNEEDLQMKRQQLNNEAQRSIDDQSRYLGQKRSRIIDNQHHSHTSEQYKEPSILNTRRYVDDDINKCSRRVTAAPVAAPFHLQTVKTNGHRAGPASSFWYCEKMDENPSRRVADASECKPVSCCSGGIADTTRRLRLSQQPQDAARRFQQSAVAPAKGADTTGSPLNFPRITISAEEKKRAAKIAAIVLATAGFAVLLMLLVKYKRQAASVCKSAIGDGGNDDVVEDDAKSSSSTCDDDDDDDPAEGVCVYEKIDRIKCRDANFKAVMTNSEKLVEHDDKVCASQDFSKMTERLKDRIGRTKISDVFCPACRKECFANLNHKK